MGLFSSSKKEKVIDWIPMVRADQLEEFKETSHQKPVLLFKHSTRCSISFMALSRLESSWHKVEEQIIPVYLDLLAYRSISNQIAEELNIVHESPQVIILKNGQSIYNASHSNITVDAIKEML